MIFSVSSTRRSRRGRVGFTLIELLVVLLILSILAAIALPTARELIADQQVTRSARGLTAYIDRIRNRAIAEGRPFGILIERANPGTERGRSLAIRCRTMIGLSPYGGDAVNARATIRPGGGGTIIAEFNPAENQLLVVAASLIDSSSTTQTAPIQNGDLIELPGGRLVPFVIQPRPLQVTDGAGNPIPNPDNVQLTFDLNESFNGSELFPASSALLSSGQTRQIPYRIHRRPIVSNSEPFSLPNGLAIDLNFSGIGVNGNEFNENLFTALLPTIAGDPTPNPNIEIVFGADGRIESIRGPNGVSTPPVGQIFLCLGLSDGVDPSDLLFVERRDRSNLLNPDVIWVVLDPSTGRVTSSPSAAVNVPNGGFGVIDDPCNGTLVGLLGVSREFAGLSDTLAAE